MQLKYSDITEKIMGGAMKVHQKRKAAYVESIYQKCSAIELKKAQLNYFQQVEMPIYYDRHMAPALNSLQTHELERGLLIDSGAESLRFKRLIKQKKTNQETTNPAHPIIP